jgi:hypothetical protein
MPAMRIGYSMPAGMCKMTVEINATGPYSYQITDSGFTTGVSELITQLSLGLRIII